MIRVYTLRNHQFEQLGLVTEKGEIISENDSDLNTLRRLQDRYHLHEPQDWIEKLGGNRFYQITNEQ